jgi:hypothetical protein
MFSPMIKIDDLRGAWEVLVGNPPHPFCPTSHDDTLLRSSDTATDSLGLDAIAKWLGSLDRPNMGGGSLIPYRISRKVQKLDRDRHHWSGAPSSPECTILHANGFGSISICHHRRRWMDEPAGSGEDSRMQ